MPAAMATGAVILSFVTVAVDRAGADGLLRNANWIYSGGAEGASAVLGTVASSMMTVTGLVFSMTLLTLSLASSQFGPRLLRNFMRDTTNQFVLGTFVATFIYSLLVLRTIRRADEVAFVPHFSVTLGVAFSLASLGVLIYFIHHISISIQADEIIARVAHDLMEQIDREFPKEPTRGDGDSEQPSHGSVPDPVEADGKSMDSRREGYLQYTDMKALMALAVSSDLLLRLERRPGQYVVRGRPLAVAWPRDRIADDAASGILSSFSLGTSRTAGQDVEFSLHQLVEIAVRALSPGINDPFTAVTCVDRLGSALSLLTERSMPSRYHYDDAGQLRIIAQEISFADVTDAAFNQIRQNSESTAAVTIRLLETLATIAVNARRPADKAAILRHAEMVARGAERSLPEAEDRRVVMEHLSAVQNALAPREAKESGP